MPNHIERGRSQRAREERADPLVIADRALRIDGMEVIAESGQALQQPFGVGIRGLQARRPELEHEQRLVALEQTTRALEDAALRSLCVDLITSMPTGSVGSSESSEQTVTLTAR